MASRRLNEKEETLLDKKGVSLSTSQDSDTSPAVPTAVIFKLLAFTVAMFAAPLGAYFLTLNHVFKGNSTYAGATAAVVANGVLVAYIVVAMMEDRSEARMRESKEKKTE